MRATFLLHGVMSGFIAYLLGLPDAYLIVAFLLGMMNDVIPFVDGLFNPSMRWQRFYKMFHVTKGFKWWVWLIPFMNLHALIDWFWHDENGKWKDESYYLEGLMWLGFVLFIAIKYWV